jgi:hypothetical protein
MPSTDPATREGWFRLYLATIVMVPVGMASLVIGALRTATPEPVAVTLVVMGFGLVVFGAFGPRMAGPFRIGPQGAEGGLTPAGQQTVNQTVDRRLDSEANVQVTDERRQAIQSWVRSATAGLLEHQVPLATTALSPATTTRKQRRRYLVQQVPHDMPADMLERIAEALTDVALAEVPPDERGDSQGSSSK